MVNLKTKIRFWNAKKKYLKKTFSAKEGKNTHTKSQHILNYKSKT